ncbi:MAG: hypothetical protein V1494_03295 [Candidatus Diapherotrites archaeon]
MNSSLNCIEAVNKQCFQTGNAISFMHGISAEGEEKIRGLNHLIHDIKHGLEEDNLKNALERIKENGKKEKVEWQAAPLHDTLFVVLRIVL